MEIRIGIASISRIVEALVLTSKRVEASERRPVVCAIFPLGFRAAMG